MLKPFIVSGLRKPVTYGKRCCSLVNQTARRLEVWSRSAFPRNGCVNPKPRSLRSEYDWIPDGSIWCHALTPLLIIPKKLFSKLGRARLPAEAKSRWFWKQPPKDEKLATMKFPGRLILFAPFGLGLVGAIVCVAAMIGLWTTSARMGAQRHRGCICKC